MVKNADRPGELILDNRHLLLIFLGIVGICGVFFAFGYIVGRNTLSPSVATALAESGSGEGSTKPSPMPPAVYYQRPETSPVPAAQEPGTSQPELQFDQNLGGRSPEARLETPESAGAAASAPAPAGQPNPPSEPARQSGVVQPPPGILIQVSALTRQQDAETLVQLLKEKKLPVLVTTAPGDSLFHVVVGPYQSEREAQQVKRTLEEDGFQPIIKR
ncbi:MAG: Sporulation related protein [Acidobacteria bacterium]|nr:Sporulation related protein [Acidobacteriota bacterium]